MALSKQQADHRSLRAFAEWADAAGYQVGEFPPYGKVTPGVHRDKSWHYDTVTVNGKTYGKALDLNWPGGGAVERTRLRLAVVVAESMGLAVIYAMHGTQGSAAAHRTHLHADVGSWTNLGAGARAPRTGDLFTWDLQPALGITGKARDNLWGVDTDKRLLSIREASLWRGPRYPYGVKYLQGVLGVKATGKVNDATKAAHDEAVERVQKVLQKYGLYHGKIDGRWGPLTDAAWATARNRYRRR